MISDAADEVGDGFQIKSLNGETSFSTDHTVIGTYDNTIMKLTVNSNVTDSKVTVSGDITANDVSLQDGKNII